MPKPIPPATIETVLPPNTEYTYFANWRDHRFRHMSHKFQMVNAWWLAEASLLAYAEPAFAKPHFEEAGLHVEGEQPFRGASTQCYVVHNDDCVIVAFRGTQVLKPGLPQALRSSLSDVLRDIYTDAKFSLIDSGQGGYVHKGFKEGLDVVWHDQLEPYLQQLRADHPQRPFWFTGHSLGAALATLAADRYGSVRGLYTFGSPLVGDEEFARDFYVDTYRFVNNNDIVARVPPLGPYTPLRLVPGRYKHVGQLKYIDRDGHIFDNPSRWERLVDGFRGSFAPLINAVGHLRSGWIWEIPLDHLTDHAPLYYALRIWNNYEKDLPTGVV